MLLHNRQLLTALQQPQSNEHCFEETINVN
jgi:hypothetical protein